MAEALLGWARNIIYYMVFLSLAEHLWPEAPMDDICVYLEGWFLCLLYWGLLAHWGIGKNR